MSTPDSINQMGASFNAMYGIIQDSLLNNIVLFAIMLIIYLYISADGYQSYVYADIFVFMSMLTNPKPCKKEKPPEPAAPAPPIQTTKGGSVADQMGNVASSIKNVGNQINSFTASVKKDIDYDAYINDTLGKFKETYCDDMDTMSLMGAFFFVMHSSFLACYNSIQFLNFAIIKLLTLKVMDHRYYIGIFILYSLFLLSTLASSSFVSYLMKLLYPKMPASMAFVNKILFSIFSSIISLFFVYFMISIVAYMTYLSFGVINIKSDQSELGFKIIYLLFIIIIPIIALPSILGISLI
jgi:hypothetical protein